MSMQRCVLILIGALALSAAGCIRSGSPFVNPTKGDASGNGGAVDDGADAPADDAGGTDGGEGNADTGSADTGGDTGAPGTGTGTGTGSGSGSGNGGLSPVVVGSWNLHNFSKYGAGELRMDDIVSTIEGLGIDVLAVEELKLVDGSNGSGEQAFDVLIDKLDGYDGIHAPWKVNDTAVGLIWNTETTTLESWDVLFENDWSAFPRPPIDATVTVHRDGGSSTFHVVVLHLKAFKGEDNVDRRRKACTALIKHAAEHPDDRFIVIGDFNDDPYDDDDENSYQGTFLDNEPAWHFVTYALPLGTVTSTGYGTSVDGEWLKGEFLDHAVVTGGLFDAYSKITPTVMGKPESEFSAWKKSYSDHFPLLLEFTP